MERLQLALDRLGELRFLEVFILVVTVEAIERVLRAIIL